MSVSTCPKCREEVCVPLGASAQARVRCPLCQDEFELSEALGNMPPALEVLNDPVASAGGGGAFGFAASGADNGFSFGGGGGGLAVATAPATEAPAFQFEEGAAPASNGASTSVARRPAQRRGPKKNVIVEMVKVVGGGVVGLAIALVLLWWLPFGLDRDPFQLGPKVPSYLSFIVPAKYRQTATTEETTQTAPGDDANNVAPANKVAKSDRAETTASFNVDSSEDSNSGLSPFPFPQQDEEKDNNTNSLDGSTDTGSSETSSSDTSSTEAQPPEDEPLRLRDTGTVSASDLLRVAEDYAAKGKLWNSSASLTGEEKQSIDEKFYVVLAALGEVITFADPEDQEIEQEVTKASSLLKSLAGNDARFKFVANQAARWLDEPSIRKNVGVMLAGSVVEVHPHGTGHECEIELASDTPRKVKVLMLGDLDGPYGQGAKVVLPAVVLDDPKDSILGYRTNASEVVCARHAIVLTPGASVSKPEPPAKTPSTDDPAESLPSVPIPSLDLPSIPIPSVDLPSTPPSP